MPRVVIHLGFHKTGTSSLQAFLRENRPILSKYMRIFLKGQVKIWEKCATNYSVDNNPMWLSDLKENVLYTLGNNYAAKKPLLISCEGLAGRSPGKLRIDDFSAVVRGGRGISDQ